MGWFTVMIDSNSWSPQQHAAAAREIAFYKSTLRPLIPATPTCITWDRDRTARAGTDWNTSMPARDRAVLYAFHASAATPDEFRFNLRGLRSDRRYRVHFRDHSSPDREVDGRELMQSGLAVALPMANSSELVTIEALR